MFSFSSAATLSKDIIVIDGRLVTTQIFILAEAEQPQLIFIDPIYPVALL